MAILEANHLAIKPAYSLELKSAHTFRRKADTWTFFVDIPIYINGEQVRVDSAYLRGSNILFVNVPEMFSNARLLKPRRKASLPAN
jgi:hypothetical protein